MFEKLASVYHPDEPEISNILALAKNVPKTQSITEYLQFRLWMNTEKDIHSVFENLDLDKQGIVDVLNDPRLCTWLAYVQFWQKILLG
ncbi:hypothetical protein PsorP6_004141 [Peronosclerospora sorghi]|uniref:Uncharacterized protein n=1 Tax=Peronosclerospora sorghi TaxID=230839 RepID=A0ACC0VNT7_9STRA|nr:hypothetical protein PsorP6_004141 [Peronosclerospora sorghi]